MTVPNSGPNADELRRLLTLERYPRSAGYDPAWVMEHMMGPHPLWLAESLSEALPLAPGSRVPDLGCGKALTSIFLAREFGVQVWAADLWIKPTENLARIRDAGLADRVFPIYAEAHALPFAEGFFDAIVSVDAYQYFGTADLYLGYCLSFLMPGGRIGIAVPGLTAEPESFPPPGLEAVWEPDFTAFHSPAWWRRHWGKTGLVNVETADLVPHGWEDWLRWSEACDRTGRGFPGETDLLRMDGGRWLGFTRLVASRR